MSLSLSWKIVRLVQDQRLPEDGRLARNGHGGIAMTEAVNEDDGPETNRGCAREFIDYLAFYAFCKMALSCAADSAAINLLNRCMPATKNDKYLQVH
jgi:hypothetical protein